MNKFKNATKRITAVAASAVMISSAAFAGGLGDYPNNFVSGGEFEGQVVVGTAAQPVDTTSAMSIIDDLAAQFSGDSTQVKITYKAVSEGGETVNGVDSKDTLNFGENLGDVDEELDSDVSDVLEDGSLDNDDYTQELILQNGEFDYRIFDEVDDEDTAEDGLYYSANTAFAQYVLDFEDNVDISTADLKSDLVGEEMTIMGNEFTVVEIDDTKLVLIGGSNKIALGEGESTTVSVDGTSYEVVIQSVSTDEVLLTVNGQSRTIDEFDTEDVGGVSIAVTELVESSRDAVKGYAELVIGGQKVELTTSKIKINDEDLDDVYDEYDVSVSFTDAALGSTTATEFEGMVISYKVDDNTVLHKGDTLMDVLFDSFELEYAGVNDVDYSTFEISSSNDNVDFNGDLFNGKTLPTEFQLSTDNVASEDIYLGSNTERIFFKDTDLDITDLITANNMDALDFYNATGGATNADSLFVNVSATTTDAVGTMVFTRSADDEFYFYEIRGVDKDDLEVDFEDAITGKATNAVDYDDVDGSLEFPVTSVAGSLDALGGNWTSFNLTKLGDSILYLDNELEMDFSNVEMDAFGGADYVYLTFDYNADVEMDDAANEADSFQINLTRATDADDALELKIGASHDFVNNAGSGDEVEEDSDYDVYVDHYGTMVTVDTDKFDSVKIEVPDEEVQGLVNVNFGEGSGAEMAVTVDADAVADKRAELEEDGYTIIDEEEVSSEEVEFDVSAPVMDSDVSGMEDMIVVGGPAVNTVAAELLGLTFPTYGAASGVNSGEAVVRYFADSNSVLVYGYEGADTAAAAARLNEGGLSGDSVDVQ